MKQLWPLLQVVAVRSYGNCPILGVKPAWCCYWQCSQPCRGHCQDNLVPLSESLMVWSLEKLCFHSYMRKFSVWMDTFWKCNWLLLPATFRCLSIYTLLYMAAKTKYSCEIHLHLVFMTLVIKLDFIRQPNIVTRWRTIGSTMLLLINIQWELELNLPIQGFM